MTNNFELIDYNRFCNENNLQTNNFKHIYDRFRTLFDEQDTNLHEQMKKDCELVLLNNR